MTALRAYRVYLLAALSLPKTDAYREQAIDEAATAFAAAFGTILAHRRRVGRDDVRELPMRC